MCGQPKGARGRFASEVEVISKQQNRFVVLSSETLAENQESNKCRECFFSI